MSLDALLERALDAEGASIDPAPDAWEQLQARIEHEAERTGARRRPTQGHKDATHRRDSEASQEYSAVPGDEVPDPRTLRGPSPIVGETIPAGSPAGRGWRLAVAAGVVALAGAAVAVHYWPSASNDDQVRTGTPQGIPPVATAIAVTEDGTLLRLHVGTGEVETLAESPTDADGQANEHISGAAIGLDGMVVLSTCCSPAVGSTFRLEADRTPTKLADGDTPTFGVTGELALVAYGIDIYTVDGTLLRSIDGDGYSGNIMDLAWSPDGSLFAAEIVTDDDRREIALVRADARSMAEAVVLKPPAGSWWSDPAFRADGSLYVIEHRGDGDRRNVLRRVVNQAGPNDPLSNYTSVETVDLGEVRPSRLAAAEEGEWLLVAPTGGGALVALDPTNTVSSSPVQVGEPLTDLDW